MKMKVRLFKYLIFILLIIIYACSGGRINRITILETTDVHGVILPYDFIEKETTKSSLAGVAAYLHIARQEGGALILLDDGDNLQGQPEEYYYNFIDTLSPHFNSEVMNYLGYDAGTVGNHDIEAGHSVYDRIRKEYKFPMLAANAVDIKSGKPYFEPYKIIKKNGVKIAVFGLITPGIPTSIPPELYSGMEFRDMVETAKQWMPVILNNKPDLVVGLFHSGWNRLNDANNSGGSIYENGSAEVAYKVRGFDVIFNGHDHNIVNENFINSFGDTVLILDGGSRSEKIARADIIFRRMNHGEKRSKKASGTIINVKDFPSDPDFMKLFSEQDKIVNQYVNKVIGESTTTISSRDAYFGSSAFVDMIHRVQLGITGADVSFAAPLSFDVSIPKGSVTVGDMFKLYRFENMLYTMNMTGTEIIKYLEYSYSGWLNTMRGSDDLMLNFRMDKENRPVINAGRARLRNQSYNFDSAAGIDYVVDISKQPGHRINIKSFSDGRPFEAEKTYRVAVNSHRGNGGGGHFTEGAGIKQEELRSRLVSSTAKNLRYYILNSIEKDRIISPEPLNNWKIIPDEWVKNATLRDYKLLFGDAK